MSILDLFGGNIIEAGIDTIKDYINKDKEKLKIVLDYNEKLSEKETSLLRGQIEVNKQEAQHKSLFVAGWRPFIGWTAGFAILYYYILQPFIVVVGSIYSIEIVMPNIDVMSLYNLVLAMLGVAGLRTYEKLKGVDTKEIK